MSETNDDLPVDPALGVLRSIWEVDQDDASDVGELCGNTTVCRNMKDVSFEEMVGQGTDLRTAWREQLARDGKLDTSSGTLGDLVMGRAPVSGTPIDSARR